MDMKQSFKEIAKFRQMKGYSTEKTKKEWNRNSAASAKQLQCAMRIAELSVLTLYRSCVLNRIGWTMPWLVSLETAVSTVSSCNHQVAR